MSADKIDGHGFKSFYQIIYICTDNKKADKSEH